ncbi:hypothetical protein CBS101457_003932 [Exobasidium rhododendri]|nr:hypothetical protein CBS101457_003932 [Exobasidium rhododendri]
MAQARAGPFNPLRATGYGKGRKYDLEQIHDFAIQIALEAGVLIRRKAIQQALSSRDRTSQGHSSLSSSPSSSKVQTKSSDIDLVTELDLKVESHIQRRIEDYWSDHVIIAEESFGKNAGSKVGWQAGKGPTWYIDPIDGTMNATHALQLHCISIGFSASHTNDEEGYIEDDALVGVIYAPMLGSLGTLWSGARGEGSYLSYPAKLPGSHLQSIVDHGCSLSALRLSSDMGSMFDIEQMQVLPAQRLPLLVQELSSEAPSGILLASEWGKDRKTKTDQAGKKGNLSNKLDTFINLASNDVFQSESAVDRQNPRYLHGIRSLGSTALDLAFLAQGSVDVVWEGGCWEWDVCAGVAILLEAGGILTDSNPPQNKTSPYLKKGKRLPRAELGARRFLGVRACTSSEGETALEAQERVARAIWQRTRGLDYRREGVEYKVEASEDDDDKANTSKSTSSVRNWIDPLRERKRLTKEQAEAQQNEKGPVEMAQEREGANTFGGRLLDESKDQWSHNAWDHVEPPASYLSLIEDKLRVQEETKLSVEEAAEFHEVPASYWNSFYSSHENRFFKDRKWLHLEFPELIKASLADAPHTRILEVGCGAGNTVFPLLEINQNPRLEIFACDYSSEAISVVQNNPLYRDQKCGKCIASVWDLTSTTAEGTPNTPEGIEPHSLDVVVLIFVLSALHPNEWRKAIANVKYLLKEGGLVLVRDYGRYDLPQLRFGKRRMIDDNFYVRGDGTRVYFFTPEDFLSLFNASSSSDSSSDTVTASGDLAQHDFETLQLAMDRRMLLNRKEKKQMFRNWLQAKFKLQAI